MEQFLNFPKGFRHSLNQPSPQRPPSLGPYQPSVSPNVLSNGLSFQTSPKEQIESGRMILLPDVKSIATPNLNSIKPIFKEDISDASNENSPYSSNYKNQANTESKRISFSPLVHVITPEQDSLKHSEATESKTDHSKPIAKPSIKEPRFQASLIRENSSVQPSPITKNSKSPFLSRKTIMSQFSQPAGPIVVSTKSDPPKRPEDYLNYSRVLKFMAKFCQICKHLEAAEAKKNKEIENVGLFLEQHRGFWQAVDRNNLKKCRSKYHSWVLKHMSSGLKNSSELSIDCRDQSNSFSRESSEQNDKEIKEENDDEEILSEKSQRSSEQGRKHINEENEEKEENFENEMKKDETSEQENEIFKSTEGNELKSHYPGSGYTGVPGVNDWKKLDDNYSRHTVGSLGHKDLYKFEFKETLVRSDSFDRFNTEPLQPYSYGFPRTYGLSLPPLGPVGTGYPYLPSDPIFSTRYYDPVPRSFSDFNYEPFPSLLKTQNDFKNFESGPSNFSDFKYEPFPTLVSTQNEFKNYDSVPNNFSDFKPEPFQTLLSSNNDFKNYDSGPSNFSDFKFEPISTIFNPKLIEKEANHKADKDQKEWAFKYIRGREENIKMSERLWIMRRSLLDSYSLIEKIETMGVDLVGCCNNPWVLQETKAILKDVMAYKKRLEATCLNKNESSLAFFEKRNSMPVKSKKAMVKGSQLSDSDHDKKSSEKDGSIWQVDDHGSYEYKSLCGSQPKSQSQSKIEENKESFGFFDKKRNVECNLASPIELNFSGLAPNKNKDKSLENLANGSSDSAKRFGSSIQNKEKSLQEQYRAVLREKKDPFADDLKIRKRSQSAPSWLEETNTLKENFLSQDERKKIDENLSLVFLLEFFKGEAEKFRGLAGEISSTMSALVPGLEEGWVFDQSLENNKGNLKSVIKLAISSLKEQVIEEQEREFEEQYELLRNKYKEQNESLKEELEDLRKKISGYELALSPKNELEKASMTESHMLQPEISPKKVDYFLNFDEKQPLSDETLKKAIRQLSLIILSKNSGALSFDQNKSESLDSIKRLFGEEASKIFNELQEKMESMSQGFEEEKDKLTKRIKNLRKGIQMTLGCIIILENIYLRFICLEENHLDLPGNQKEVPLNLRSNEKAKVFGQGNQGNVYNRAKIAEMAKETSKEAKQKLIEVQNARSYLGNLINSVEDIPIVFKDAYSMKSSGVSINKSKTIENKEWSLTCPVWGSKEWVGGYKTMENDEVKTSKVEEKSGKNSRVGLEEQNSEHSRSRMNTSRISRESDYGFGTPLHDIDLIHIILTQAEKIENLVKKPGYYHTTL